jgi:hypothetical protein
MVEIPSGILKKNQVRLGGVFSADAPATAASAAAGPMARIVDLQDDYAVIEVRCECGRCAYVRCRWQGKGAATVQERKP